MIDFQPNSNTLRRDSASVHDLKSLRQDIGKNRLPALNPSLSTKQIRLAYSINGDRLKNPSESNQEPYKPENVPESLIQLKKFSGFPLIRKTHHVSEGRASTVETVPKKNIETSNVKRRRIGGPKTQFKIAKSNTNIDILEKVIVEYIDKNKTLKSSNDDLLLHPQNKIQASLNSLKVINRILPTKNIVNRQFGFDEDNLDKNHMTLERIVLERLEKIKKRREDQKFLREKEKRAIEESIITKRVDN